MLAVNTGAAPVRVVFTTRRGGSSEGGYASLNLGATTGDAPEAVRANRAALADALGVDATRIASMSQVHGAQVVAVGPEGGDGRFVGSLHGVAECDGVLARSPGVPVVAMGADCPVIALWDDDGSVVAAVHAGWRGIVGGVIGEAVRATGIAPERLGAAVGPHVGPCCYPVDAHLRDTLAAAHGADVVRGDAVDLGLACRRALEAEGLSAGRISADGACTSCDAERFFSYRRDGAETGRQAVVAWIEERA